jgi:cobaltochelatase CobS
MADAAEINDEPIICQIDNVPCHSIQLHIKKNHPDWTLERYKAEYPDAPLLSEKAKRRIAENRAQNAGAGSRPGVTVHSRTRHFHEVFDLGNAKAAMNPLGQPIEISIIDGHSEETAPYTPKIDPNYVFNIDLTKKVIVGFELCEPVYLWGYHGTGKSTVLEQVAARTGRRFMRVQHERDTEAAHILGQYVVRTKMIEVDEISPVDGSIVKVMKPTTITEYQLGPLPFAMIHGLVYCADEYDVAMPGVIAVYQAVLEGKPLVIKDAPPEFRVIEPHPNFRFVATGNTNGGGDETGLYQGTIIQNAAAYSRFTITEEVQYMDPKIEKGVVAGQSGIELDDAEKIVKFAKDVRNQFADGKLSATVSPRELINAAKLAVAFGGNCVEGLKLAFINRLSRVDKKVCEGFAERIFGA